MQFTIQSYQLHAGLACLKDITAKKDAPLYNILGNVHLRAFGQTLELQATNLETAITVACGAKVIEEGSILVSAATLFGVVNQFPEDVVVEISVSETLVVEVKCGGSTVTLNGVDAVEFPVITPATGTMEELDPQGFKRAVLGTLISASKIDNRPILTGIKFEVTPTRLTLASADGYRLGIAHLEGEYTHTTEFVVPAAALRTLVKFIDRDTEELGMAFDSVAGRVAFEMGNYAMTVSTLTGNFPDYKAIIPTQEIACVNCYRHDLLKTAQMLQIFASDTADCVTLDLKDGRFTISAKSPTSGNGSTVLDGVVEGEVNLGINNLYLLDVLKYIQEDEIRVSFSGANNPITVLPATLGATYKHIIMPMSIGR